jgi:hypothetical protein
MYILDLAQVLLNAICSTTSWNCACSIGSNQQNAICPGSAMTAVAAAFGTQGMWVQANLVNQILYEGLGLWAPLLYILSAIGGLVSLALGAPPRMYMWFFVGPGIYDWLLDNPNPVHGMEWRVADVPQNQREVWKLAEGGLLNSAPAGVVVFSDRPPSTTVNVPALFLWFDEVVSDVVQGMVGWTGVYNQIVPSTNTTSLNYKGAPTAGENKWYLLSNVKWGLLENITGARLKSPDLRDSFVTFLASECGDLVKRSISQPRFIQASTAKAENLGATPSVFEGYKLLTQLLSGQVVPSPRSLKKILSDNNEGALRKFHIFLSSGFINFWGVSDRIACDQYLWLIVQSFRWEAGHIFFQLAKAAPGGIAPDDVVFSLVYGWQINPAWWPNLSTAISLVQRRFVIDLILLHLFRNELAIAPALVDQRFANSTQAESISKGYQRSVGSKAKYAELYTWAMMIPYLQGVLLYFLAIAYPFAAIMVVMPGMHKTMFTWMSFWAWVKLWDVGFALVMMMERSLWAMLGNSSSAAAANKYVLEMQTWGVTKVSCSSDELDLSGCQIPEVTHLTIGNQFPQWDDALRIFDRALVLASNLDLDLQNSYYIYIMAALYFAVPTITGQLVLGARSGAASMVNSAIGGAAQEIGKTAGSAHQSEMLTNMQANAGSVGQAAYTKQMRASGLGAKAIEFGNQAMRDEMAGSALGTAMGAQQNWEQNRGLGRQEHTAQTQVGQQLFGTGEGFSRIAKDGSASGGGTAPTPKPKGTGEAGAIDAAKATGADSSKRPGVPASGTPDPASNSATSSSNATAAAASADASSDQTAKTKTPWEQKRDNAIKGLGAQHAAFGVAKQSMDFAAAAGQAKQARELNGDLAAGAALRSGMAVASFGHNASSKGFGAAGGRAGEFASFDADMAKWDAMNAYSSQITGMAAGVYGTFGGNFNPGAKPLGSTNAMAMEGLLNTKGSDAKAAANYVDPQTKGGYFSSMGATQGKLNSSFGEGRTASGYQAWGPADAAAYNIGAAGEFLTGGVLTGGGETGGARFQQLNGGRSGAGSASDSGRMGGVFGSSSNGRDDQGANPFSGSSQSISKSVTSGIN